MAVTGSDARTETWKAIPGYRGYEASDMGRFRSVDRALPDGRRRKGQMLRTRVSNRGYVLVDLRDDSGRKVTRSGHTVVLETFAGPCPPGQEARHLHDNPLDNRWPEELCWGTKADNSEDKFRNGGRNRAAPKPPRRCVRCGGVVTRGGRRCHACVVDIGERAAMLLRGGMRLEDAAAELGYPSVAGLHTLAVKYGGYGVPRHRRWSQKVTATLRGWRHGKPGGDTP